MNRMLIVGNGFDLEHGLKTAYWNFREYLEENHLDFLIAFEKMYNFYPIDFGSIYGRLSGVFRNRREAAGTNIDQMCCDLKCE